MKQVFFLLFSIVLFKAASAQLVHDTVPPYKKVSTIPNFTIELANKKLFTNKQIPAGKPVVLVYFNPECGHCQHAAKDFADNSQKLKDVFFIWVAYQSLEEINGFGNDYKLNGHDNIKLGRDSAYYLPTFYRVEQTPFMAVYGKNGKFLQAYKAGASAAELQKLLNI